MLRHGLSTYDFSRIANIAFVQAARDILQEQGKPLSFSRVSTITGLHRHVVSEIINSGSDASPGATRDKDYRRNRLARVLSGWFESPTYTDADGRPRLLHFEGPAPSFTSLVHDFSGDIYPRIILDELLEVGAVRALPDGALRAVTRRYTLGGADPATLEQLGQSARDLFNTLEHNIAAPVDLRLYDDEVVSASFDRAALPLFRRLLKQRGAAFLEDIEGWISEHEKPGSPDTTRAGVTVRMFIDEDKEVSDTSPDGSAT
ncbi:MAG: DUF6502 family protein [Pseudomonadota bacterium]|nr:DUF6502 family protein [Pseudomonadota bacterium]